MNDDDDEMNQDEVSAAEAFYVKEGNDKRVLMAMGIGLANDDDSPFMSFNDKEFKSVKVSTLKPTNSHLVGEQRRRRHEKGEKSNNFNTQAKRKDLWDYLLQNPVVNPPDVDFLKREIKSLAAKAVAMERSKKNAGSSSLKWSGSAPFYRLLHAITDVPANKAAFMDSFRVNTTEETDGRNNPETARPRAWDMIANTFNSKRFQPTSKIYTESHPDLAEPVDISYESVVAVMGELDGEKAKSKFMGMKNLGSIVIARYDKSGNGDGKVAEEERDFSRGEDDVLELSDNDYTNNLLGFGTHVLYFIKHILLHGIVAQAIQQLKNGYRLDGKNIPSARSGGNRRKKGRKGSSNDNERGSFDRQMTETNKQIARLNESVLVKNIFMFKEKVRELKRSVRQMRRGEEPDEDIKDEELFLEDARVDLEEAEKRLESSRESDKTKFNEPSEDAEDGAADRPNWDEYDREHVGH
jgi:hypothetical protein